LYEYNAELHVPVAEPVQNIPGAVPQVGPGPVGTIDWVSIVALTGGAGDGNPNISWGWHNRDYGIFDPLAIGNNPSGQGENDLTGGLGNTPFWHFEDDGVSNPGFAYNPTTGASTAGPDYNGLSYPVSELPPGSPHFSEDLAFALYTGVPEPTSLGLVGFGLMALVGRRNRAMKGSGR
jgi:hypothetical protein